MDERMRFVIRLKDGESYGVFVPGVRHFEEDRLQDLRAV